MNRFFRNAGYHNEFVWPWVTCQNIRVKIKIGLLHPESAIRNAYKKEAVDDLVAMARIFRDAGGAYEILKPNEPKAAKSLFYDPPKKFIGSMSAYQGAYAQLSELGWI